MKTVIEWEEIIEDCTKEPMTKEQFIKHYTNLILATSKELAKLT